LRPDALKGHLYIASKRTALYPKASKDYSKCGRFPFKGENKYGMARWKRARPLTVEAAVATARKP
jgi:hypothetical protein